MASSAALREIDAHLDDLAARDAEIMPLEIGARDSWGLRPRQVQRQGAPGDQRRYRDDLRRFHVKILVISVPTEVSEGDTEPRRKERAGVRFPDARQTRPH